MKKVWLLVSAGAGFILACMLSAPVGAETYRLNMWIAPLECTRSQVVDGVTVTTIITPQQCDDLLNPPAAPPNALPPTNNGATPAPTAPDTGVFNDTSMTFVGTSTALLVFASALYALRRERIRHSLRKPRH